MQSIFIAFPNSIEGILLSFWPMKIINNIKNYLVLNHPLISQLSLLKKFLVIFI